jgi:hypothetical protein
LTYGIPPARIVDRKLIVHLRHAFYPGSDIIGPGLLEVGIDRTPRRVTVALIMFVSIAKDDTRGSVLSAA